MNAAHWLVTIDSRGHVLTDAEFMEFADRVKYDGIEYQAQPLQLAREVSQ